jgi:hypothetical protein
MLCLGLVVGIFFGLLAGVFVERKLSVIDNEDPSYGWKDMYYELHEEHKKELEKSSQYLQYCIGLIDILCKK